MTPARVVLVLGGGGAKTAAHIGVARALAEAGVAPMRWIGTSMGAVMAAALASGRSPDDLLRQVLTIGRRDVVRTNWRALVRGIWSDAVLRPAPLRRLIEELVPARRFGELTVPATITAVEAATGREVAFGSDGEDAPLVDVLLAACAIPPYFPPVLVNGRAFVDGGIRSAVPIGWAESIHCDLVIAVDTAPGFDEGGERVDTPPPLISAMDTAMGWLIAGTTQLQRGQWERSGNRPPLIWLRPVTDRGAMFAADRTAKYVEAGYLAMQQAWRSVT
jgi:predicted acylesterase/phospholipase RssA